MTGLNDRSSPNVQVNLCTISEAHQLYGTKNLTIFDFLDNDDGFIAAMEINSDSEILSREKRHDSLWDKADKNHNFQMVDKYS